MTAKTKHTRTPRASRSAAGHSGSTNSATTRPIDPTQEAVQAIIATDDPAALAQLYLDGLVKQEREPGLDAFLVDAFERGWHTDGFKAFGAALHAKLIEFADRSGVARLLTEIGQEVSTLRELVDEGSAGNLSKETLTTAGGTLTAWTLRHVDEALGLLGQSVLGGFSDELPGTPHEKLLELAHASPARAERVGGDRMEEAFDYLQRAIGTLELAQMSLHEPTPENLALCAVHAMLERVESALSGAADGGAE